MNKEKKAMAAIRTARQPEGQPVDEKEKRRLRALIDEAINETQATLDELWGALEFFSPEELDREFEVNELDEQVWDYEFDRQEWIEEAGQARLRLSAARDTIEFEKEEE